MPWRDRANHAKVVSMAEAFICDKSSNRAWAFWIAKEIEALDHTPLVRKWSASTPPIKFSAWCHIRRIPRPIRRMGRPQPSSHRLF